MPVPSVQLSRKERHWQGTFEAMASPCAVLCELDSENEARRLAELAAAEVLRIEARFSRYRDDNIVARINSAEGAPVEVDSETARLLDFSAQLHTLSGRLFDITSGALRTVWIFDGSDRLPDPDKVAAVVARIGWDKASWQPPVLQLPAGMEIDFGGVGKEYAVDRAADLLREASDCSCLVNLGGDLAVTRAPHRFADWRVGIEAVSIPGQIPASMLKLRTGALATSGDARRFLEKDGVRYGHILDPTSGWPVRDAPHSVTVAADTCTQAGMLSTLAMLQGAAAEEFLRSQGVQFWCQR